MQAAKKMDVNFFKPFVDGTLYTLKTQCQVEATPGKPFFKSDQPAQIYDITGVIGLTSSAFNGTISLCFPKRVFLMIMTNMLGEPCEEINKDLESGAAELLNIIFGQAKTVLNEKGYAIQKAIPTVVSGQALHTTQLTSSPVVVLPFKTLAGELHIEICTEGATLT